MFLTVEKNNVVYLAERRKDMLNQIVLVGRLVYDIKVNKTDAGKKIATITLAVPRSFKNKDGLYDTDFIDCLLWDNVATNTSTYCKKGDIVGIKGRIQSRIVTDNDQNNKTEIQLIAEKVTFLSSKKEDEKSNN